jgi:hypothetical protein
MNFFKKNKFNYEMIHDNLNGQWLIADLSNKKYKFFCRSSEFSNDKRVDKSEKKRLFI